MLLEAHPAMSVSHFICNCLSTILYWPVHLLRAFPYLLNLGQALPVKQKKMPKYYHDDEAWADVEPLPQNDGGLHPLAAIAYTEEYSEAMGYLRAVMANNEFSERVLGLTEHIISMNPAHYTVW
jgi:protein farnesyltransferase/geranylgeranyltransferase type-1 subunit alpha